MTHVILIGDSIRMAYQPLVAEQLGDGFNAGGPEENGGTSANVLAHLEAWALSQPVDIVHVNCGLHDLAQDAPGRPRVEVSQYVRNVENILLQLASTGARVIWGTTTPVLDDLHNSRKPFQRYHTDVCRYNEAALHVVSRLRVPVNDLYSIIFKNGVEESVYDGVHMKPTANALLANAVTNSVRKQANHLE